MLGVKLILIYKKLYINKQYNKFKLIVLHEKNSSMRSFY
jgi:hypothetical protein